MSTLAQRRGAVKHPAVRVIYRLGDHRSFVTDATVAILSDSGGEFHGEKDMGSASRSVVT